MGNILLVDDTSSCRAPVQRMLEIKGHRVVGFDSPREALERWRDLGTIDVVISDINMPHMQGPELISRLREISNDPVYLGTTGYGTHAEQKAMYDAGVKIIIPKPCRFDVMTELVDYCVINRERINTEQEDLQSRFLSRLSYDSKN